MIDFDFKTGKKDIQLFARIVPVVLLIWGTVFGFKHNWQGRSEYIFYGVAVVLFLGGMFSPFTLKPVYLIWMVITRWIAWLLTTLVLGLVFYIGFTGVGVVMRLFGRDPLYRKIEKQRPSYWHKRSPVRFERSHYERQF